jgi:CBS domain-containing protein
LNCPVCSYDNLEGLDSCENCGADLRASDIPQPRNDFSAQLMSGRLADLDPRSPIAVKPGDSVTTAISAMQAAEVGCVLVNQGEKLVGILTERDAVLKLAGKPLAGIKVKDAMTKDPVVLRDDDTLAVALHKMAVGGFRHIPLVEEGRPTGIISSRDIFRHIVTILD